jgi:PAS domain S-box-containing protein
LSNGFRTISLTDVLQGRIPQNLMRDRIVLIGLMAESLESVFFTSYTTNSIEAPVGVEVHALLTSQLLSAALDGRPMLRVWSDLLEWVWIILWSVIGAVIGWVSRSPTQTVLRAILLGAALLGSTYVLFLAGWWIITVPPLLALVGSTVVSSSYLLWENLKEHARTLEQKVAARTLELSQQKQLLQTIVDHVPVMLTLYDATGKIKFVNRQFEQMLGWSTENLHPIDLIAELSSDPQQQQQILEHMLTATGTWLDLKLKTKSNRLVNTSWANVPISDHLFVGIGQDISDRKRAEEASILDERNRMAREIHDTLAQAFTGILLHIGAIAEEVPEESVTVQTHLETVDELARSGLSEARRSVAALRPKLLEEGSLSDAIKHLTAQMKSSTNINITYEINGATNALSPDLENHLLRIGQEALTNAIKYAHATHIHIEFVCEETQCVLRIKDNGRGFDVDQVSLSKGYGLLGMSERVEKIGGELVIQSQPGQGAEITVVVNRE